MLTKKRLTIMIIWSFLIGLMLGTISYFGGVKHLFNYFIAGETFFSPQDVYFAIFVHSDFSRFEYLDRSDIMILFLPFFYYFTGVMLGVAPFLTRDKVYHQFIYARVEKRRQLVTFFHGYGFLYMVFFSTAYFITIATLLKLFPPTFLSSDIQVPFSNLLIFFSLRLLMLLALTYISFIMFIHLSTALAVFINVILIAFIFIFNMQIKMINFAFFEITWASLNGALIWSAIIISCYFYMIHKMIYELK